MAEWSQWYSAHNGCSTEHTILLNNSTWRLRIKRDISSLAMFGSSATLICHKLIHFFATPLEMAANRWNLILKPLVDFNLTSFTVSAFFTLLLAIKKLLIMQYNEWMKLMPMFILLNCCILVWVLNLTKIYWNGIDYRMPFILYFSFINQLLIIFLYSRCTE